MLKHQRDSLDITQCNKQTTEMQVFSRRIAQNLLKRTTLQTLPYATGVQFNLTSAPQQPHNHVVAPFRNFATKTDAKKEQKLLCYPALPLEETLPKFLKSIEPFLSKEDFETHRKEIDVFLKCDGPKLQKLLEQAASTEDNWLADRWLRFAYMQFRDPVVVYSSPGMSFPMVSHESDHDYLNYVAKVIFSFLKFKEMIDTDKVPVQKMGNDELDNGQFGRVFGTCRIPFPNEDKVQYNPSSTHVAVIYKNHFYKLPVYSKALKPVHPDKLFEQLQKIYEAEKTAGTPFGILTSDHRDNWASAYKDLLAVKGNKESVEEIQKCLFTVSLDSEVCVDKCENKKSVLAEYLIHGRGSSQNAANRWFDKTIQLLVSRNGFSGFCYEHSPAEGQPIALMVDYMCKNLGDCNLAEGAESKEVEPAKKLNLASSPEVDKHIAKAKANLDKLACDLQMNVVHFKEYGKGFLKLQKLSPDSFIQMALQYAFYKLYKEPGAAYESAHLRIFKNGRTETIRSCSTESMAFCKAMTEPNDDKLRVDLLRKAVNAHREYTTMALRGKGVDRHLLGLKLMAQENKLTLPNFFSLPGVAKSSHFRLSTSQVASVNEAFMCYGPMYPDGYSCCYNPRENDIILAVGAWKSNADTCADGFGVSLEEAFKEMSGVLCRGGEKPKAKL